MILRDAFYIVRAFSAQLTPCFTSSRPGTRYLCLVAECAAVADVPATAAVPGAVAVGGAGRDTAAACDHQPATPLRREDGARAESEGAELPESACDRSPQVRSQSKSTGQQTTTGQHISMSSAQYIFTVYIVCHQVTRLSMS